MKLNQLQRGGLLILALGLSACGGSGGGITITSTPVQGKLVQGPVDGATIFADKIVGSAANFQLDAGEQSDITHDGGKFNLDLPGGYGSYVLVSQGGFYTLNDTKIPAMQMVAPAGSANVTPLTTLVALAPADKQAAIKLLIEATGVSFDADISTSATPAALLLTKSVETAIATLGKGIDPTGTKLTSTQLCDVQQKALSAIATSFASAPSLLNTADLKSAISTGITNAIPTISGNDGITVKTADIATIAAAVSDTVTTVAHSMGNDSGTFATSGTVTEAAQFTPAAQSAIDDAITSKADTAAVVVTVVPTAPTVVLTSSSLTGIDIKSPVAVTFSRPMNATTINSTTFKINGVAGTVSYNSATQTATFDPANDLNYDATYTVALTSGIKDNNGTALVPASLTFRTVVRPLTGSTGSNGTGANF